jgi:peptide/nickel transport system substrate-binding protein
MNRRSFLELSLYSTLAATLLIGCESAAPSDTPQETVQTPAPAQPQRPLRVAFPGSPKQMIPALYSVFEEYQLGFAIFDGLIWVDETLTPQPLLASAWEVSRDALTWTFELERNVTFHHGAPFTAADVLYTFNRLLDPQGGSAFRSVLRFIDEVASLDDYTVRFHLSKPNVELPLLLGAPQASIVAHDYADNLLTSQPSGTGPFRFVTYIPHEQVKLVRNPDYWASSESYIEELEYLYLDYDEQVPALQNGEIDVIAQLGTDDIPRLQGDPTVHVVDAQSGNYQTIVMQATEAPFTDRRVRQALKYCADHAALQQQVLQGRGAAGNNHPVAPISPFWAELPKHEQDIAKAKTLLAQAGYARGLKLDLITSSSRPGMLELAAAFREMARQVGVEIKVVRVPADVYWSDYGGKTPFHIGNWGFRPSIDETFMNAYHSTSKNNESKWSSPKLDELIDSARSEQDQGKRKELYVQAQQLLLEEGAVIIPYFRPVAIALRSTIQNFFLHPAGWLDFSTVRIA